MKLFKRTLAVILSIMLILAALPMTVSAAVPGYEEMTLDNPVRVEKVAGETNYKLLCYTPSVTGYYAFETTPVSGNLSFVASVSTESDKLIGSTDSYNGETSIECMLYSGVTYLYVIGFNYDLAGCCEAKVVLKEEINVTDLSLDTEVLTEIATPGQRIMYSFTPEVAGNYTFSAVGNENPDNKVELYDFEGEFIAEDDDNNGYGNFKISQNMEAGKTYYFSVFLYDETEVGTIPVILEKSVVAESIEVVCTNERYGDIAFVGKVLSYTVKPSPEGAPIDGVSWSVSDQEVADVFYTNENEVAIEFYGTGTVDITAETDLGLKDSLTVTVKEVPVTVLTKGVEVNVDAYESRGYDIISFTPEEAGDYVFAAMGTGVWRVVLYDENSLTLYEQYSDNNRVRIPYYLEAGVTYNYCVESDELVVFSAVVGEDTPATGIEIIGENINGSYGENIEMFVKPVPSYAELDESVVWQSNDENVAVFGGNILTFVGFGTATVTATMGELTATAEVTCNLPTELTIDQTVRVNIDREGRIVYYSFVPSKSAKYMLSSKGAFDTQVYLYDAEFNELDYNDDYEDTNFGLECVLEEGVTYYYGVRMFSLSEVGEFDITLTEKVYVKELKVKDFPNNTYEHGELYETVDYSGLILDVVWSDGSVTNWYYNAPEEIDGYAVEIECEENPLTGYIIIYCGEIVLKHEVEFFETNVASLELIKESEQVYYENIDGYFDTDENDNEYFYYYLHNHNDAVVRIHYTDGSHFDVNLNDYVDGSWIEIFDEQYEKHFTRGTNYVTVAYKGKSVLMPVEVVENPVDKIEVLKASTQYYVLNYGGYSYFDQYEYETFEHEDAVIRIYYNDGTTKDASLENLDYRILDDQEEKPWAIGSENNYVIISYMNRSVKMPITLIENPVEKIEIEKGTNVTYIENYRGYYDYDINGNEYFRYNEMNHDDAIILIKYKDGTTKTARPYEVVDGFEIELSGNQYRNPWKVGGDNSFTVSYLDNEAELPITVIENPVLRIDVDDEFSLTIMENTNGYMNGDFYYYNFDIPGDLKITVYLTDGTTVETTYSSRFLGTYFNRESYQESNPWTKDGENFVEIELLGRTDTLPVIITENTVDRIVLNSIPTKEYYMWDEMYGFAEEDDYVLWPTEFEGLSFTVYYKDGTSKTYTHKDIDDEGKIDGYDIYIYDSIYIDAPGTYPFTFTYMGVELEYDVKVLGSNVKSMEFTRLPDNLNYSSEGFAAPDLSGAEIKITYFSGVTETISVTKDMFEFFFMSSSPYYEIDKRISVSYDYEEGMYKLHYNGYNLYLDNFNIIDYTVDSIEVKKFRLNGKGMIVNLVLSDGTEKEITTKVIDSAESEYGLFGITESYAGLMLLNIDPIYDQQGELEGYCFFIADNDVNVYDVPGDCDNDKMVNTTDLAMLKLYLAGVMDDVELFGANFDCDSEGVINTTDLAELKLYLAGI
ncbi:MAG: hypothetical protein IJ946_07105 [Clostridia bacterium]|nr:hypothetical protein [Clostridia bacterium]